VRRLYDSGLTPAQVQANPKLVPNLPFVENIWPGLKGQDFPGSASANYFNCVYGDYNGSFLDCLHEVDRNVTSGYVTGQCFSVAGCYTFFPLQGSSICDLDDRWQSSVPCSRCAALSAKASSSTSITPGRIP
jgi:hypothetical protein